MIKTPSITDDPNYEHFAAFVRVAEMKVPTVDGIAAFQLKQSVETHIEGLTTKQRRGFLEFVAAQVRLAER